MQPRGLTWKLRAVSDSQDQAQGQQHTASHDVVIHCRLSALCLSASVSCEYSVVYGYGYTPRTSSSIFCMLHWAHLVFLFWFFSTAAKPCTGMNAPLLPFASWADNLASLVFSDLHGSIVFELHAQQVILHREGPWVTLLFCCFFYEHPAAKESLCSCKAVVKAVRHSIHFLDRSKYYHEI